MKRNMLRKIIDEPQTYAFSNYYKKKSKEMAERILDSK